MIPRVTRTADVSTRSKPGNVVILASSSSKTIKADVDVLIKEQSSSYLVSSALPIDLQASHSQQFGTKSMADVPDDFYMILSPKII